MERLTTCSWCHRAVRVLPGRATYCMGCGHRADVPRISCDCPSCEAVKSAVSRDVDARAWWESAGGPDIGEVD